MGRGRQKAKATKQARDIKYYSPSTDYSALQRELTGASSHAPDRYAADSSPEDAAEYEDKYADPFDEEDETSRRIG